MTSSACMSSMESSKSSSTNAKDTGMLRVSSSLRRQLRLRRLTPSSNSSSQLTSLSGCAPLRKSFQRMLLFPWRASAALLLLLTAPNGTVTIGIFASSGSMYPLVGFVVVSTSSGTSNDGCRCFMCRRTRVRVIASKQCLPNGQQKKVCVGWWILDQCFCIRLKSLKRDVLHPLTWQAMPWTGNSSVTSWSKALISWLSMVTSKTSMILKYICIYKYAVW